MKRSIFENIPKDLKEEIIETIVESDSVKIERIISNGQSSHENFWYDQHKNELVFVLKRKAKLEIENGGIVELCKGDSINIPAHQKHRVE